MKFSKKNGNYVIRFEKGEELVATLDGFCKKKGIFGGFFYGIGACNDVELAWFDAETKEYSGKKFSGGLFEVANVTGNVTKEKIHAHMTIADRDNNAFCGHLVKAVVGPTLEVFLRTCGELSRFEDEETGLQLMDLGE